MKKVMCGVLMLGWIPTLAVVAGARWTEALFAQGRTPLKVTRIYTGPDGKTKAEDFAPLKGVASRHVDFAFFVQNLPDGTPDFEQSIQLFDNGVVSRVNFEFGGLPVLGTLRKLEMLEPQTCN